MWIYFMSIRTKLTIWYTSVLALVLVAFGAGVYTVMTIRLVRSLEEKLDQAAGAAVSVFIVSPRITNNKQSDPVRVPFKSLDPYRDVLVELMDNKGSVIGVSSNLFDAAAEADNGSDKPPAPRYLPLDRSQLTTMIAQPADAQVDAFTQIREPGVPALYVLTRRIVVPAQDGKTPLPLYVQTASSFETIENAQQVLFLSMLGLGSVGLLISAVLGAFLARRALRPVDRITQTAMAIYRAENLDQRVPSTNSEDEVGRLSGAFNEMLDRLSRVFNAQQRLVADVSHEMRTPLTVIRGNVDLLNAMGCADMESLEALKRESDRMTRMVGDLLLLSQADTGQLSMQLQPTALAPILADVERSGKVLAGDRHRVVMRVDQSLMVIADSDRLKQVLLNLTDNAIKHTPVGGLVTIEAIGVFNGFARISVSDTGQGIPEADLPHVFERFFRVDKSRSRERGGSGLGLSIAQKIVEAHKGRITVSSTLAKGTTFDVYIPVAADISPEVPLETEGEWQQRFSI